MNMQILYTHPFPFVHPIQSGGPKRPVRQTSSLHHGFQGHFGFAVEPNNDFSVRGIECFFFEIDLETKQIFFTSANLPYVFFAHLQLCYDVNQKSWTVAVDPPLAIYKIPSYIDDQWPVIFRSDHIDRDIGQNLFLATYWNHERAYPLIFGMSDRSLLYDEEYYWTRWQLSSLLQPQIQSLGVNSRLISSIGEEGCLLISCKCIYDDVSNSTMYRKTGGPGQWRLHLVSYRHDGTCLSQQFIPNSSFPVRDMKVSQDDLKRWLLNSFDVTRGLRFEQFPQETFVAALVMQDNPGAYKREDSDVNIRAQPLQTQGGVYLIDLHGSVLDYDATLTGIQNRICCCSSKIIGVTFQDGEWQLWSWFPLTGEKRNILGHLSNMIVRATPIAPETKMDESFAWFWCIEEYIYGICVTRRKCVDGQILQTFWCDGAKSFDWLETVGVTDQKAQNFAVYQTSLLMAIMNKEDKLQFLLFNE